MLLASYWIRWNREYKPDRLKREGNSGMTKFHDSSSFAFQRPWGGKDERKKLITVLEKEFWRRWESLKLGKGNVGCRFYIMDPCLLGKISFWLDIQIWLLMFLSLRLLSRYHFRKIWSDSIIIMVRAFSSLIALRFLQTKFYSFWFLRLYMCNDGPICRLNWKNEEEQEKFFARNNCPLYWFFMDEGNK